MKEVDWSKPLSEDMEGLMALKYESENPVGGYTSQTISLCSENFGHFM